MSSESQPARRELFIDILYVLRAARKRSWWWVAIAGLGAYLLMVRRDKEPPTRHVATLPSPVILDIVDEAGMESFPASDPPSYSFPGWS